MISLDRALLYRGTLWDFVGIVWPRVEPASLTPNWHLPLVCEHLEAVSRCEIRNLLINEPPGCTKSLLVNVIWPVWHWLRIDPTAKWIYGSYDQSLVGRRDGGKIISLMLSEWFVARWGEMLSSNAPSAVNFETKAGGFRFATSPGGRGTGRHGNFVVIDDPTKPRDAKGKVGDQRKALRAASEWFTDTLSTRQADPSTHREVIVMQRLHKDDLAGEMLRRDGWTHLCLPMRYEPETAHPRDPRTKAGELLFPARFPEAEVQKLEKRLGPTEASAQLQQRPYVLGGTIFRREWWRFWGADFEPCLCEKCFTAGVNSEPRPHDAGIRPCIPLPSSGQEFTSWDLTFKDASSSDFVAGGAWRAAAGRMFLLSLINERLSFVDTQVAILRMAQEHEATTHLIEDKANGPAILSALERVLPGLEGITPQGGKDARARASEPPLADGRVVLPHPDICPLVWALLAQAEAFPNDVHDDMVDMVTQAVIWLMAQNYDLFSDAMRAYAHAPTSR